MAGGDGVATAAGTIIGSGAIEALRSNFRGHLLQPGEPGYDEARSVWNAMIQKRPALIARCTGVADVVAAVNFGRDQGMLTAVRGGGHNVAGTGVCDGGLLIDLSLMKQVQVDPRARTARAGGGATWADFDRETHVFGLATPGGLISATGIGGLTLGGGWGWLSRRYGLACDNLLSAEVVTAGGRVVTASADENPDLLWALRGGGGNFGVVTSMEYRLHPVDTVMAGAAFFPTPRLPELLRFYREYATAAPDELNTLVNITVAPPAPFLPPEVHGRPVTIIAGCYAGPVPDAERALEPLRRGLGQPLVDLFMPMPYPALQQMLDGTAAKGLQAYWKSHYLRALDDGAIDVINSFANDLATPITQIIMGAVGGAVPRTPAGDTAFGNRQAPYFMNIETRWERPDEVERHKNVDWARRFWEAMQPFSTGGVYVNFLGEEGEDRVRAAYGSAIYNRLAQLKKKYDPDNFFRVNQNIKPAP